MKTLCFALAFTIAIWTTTDVYHDLKFAPAQTYSTHMPDASFAAQQELLADTTGQAQVLDTIFHRFAKLSHNNRRYTLIIHTEGASTYYHVLFPDTTAYEDLDLAQLDTVSTGNLLSHY